MGTLIVNTALLRDLADSLGDIHGTLGAAEGDAQDLAGMIPHAGLAGAVNEFTGGWDRRRRELVEQVGTLRDATSGTAEGFESTDGQLADAMREGAR